MVAKLFREIQAEKQDRAFREKTGRAAKRQKARFDDDEDERQEALGRRRAVQADPDDVPEGLGMNLAVENDGSDPADRFNFRGLAG